MIEPRPEAASPNRVRDASSGLELRLWVEDQTSLDALRRLPDDEARTRHALRALRIGLLALEQARGQIDTEAVRREGDAIIAKLQLNLNNHRQGVTSQVEETLRRYFDPRSGAFPQRVEQLVKRDGELERVLREQIGSGESELGKTLREAVGADSDLMKRLSPSDSEGLLQILKETVHQELATQREQIVGQFSLDRPDTALGRLVKELKEKHGDLTQSLEERIGEVVGEFSLDEEDSALSKLVRRVETAQRQISSEFSLDDEASALARMQKEILGVLQKGAEQNAAFRADVMERLGAMRGAEETAARSTLHGDTFEARLYERVQLLAQDAGDIPRATGNTKGNIRHCQKGDYVIELGPDSAARGAKIVIEAKQDASYTLDKARAYLDEARKNRGAEVGLFVFSARSAPDGIRDLQRIGDDVFVTVDEEAESGDAHFLAGLALCRALAVRHARRRDGTAEELLELNRAILEVEKQSTKLDDISKWATTIHSSAEKILQRARVSKSKLLHQVDTLREVLEDLGQSAD